jgi:hypothetical protein
MTQEAWVEKREHMRALLTGIAESRATISYGEVSQIVFDGHFSARSSALAQMLEEVCTLEDAARGAMLGSVVVRADSGIPGKGYYLFADDKLRRDLDPTDPASCRRFWQQEVQRVWETYSAG